MAGVRDRSVHDDDVLGLLVRDEKALQIWSDAVFAASPFAAAAVSCASLADDLWRCADLQTAAHPHCAARLVRHARCLALRVAPDSAARLDRCRDPAACEGRATDVVRVVGQRMREHADGLVFTPEERRAALVCGSLSSDTPPSERRERLRCAAPLLCGTAVERLRACAAATGNGVSGLCAERARDVMLCLGETSAKNVFRRP